jgi:dTDP-D-glucose 4,6-dehydratase
MEQVRVADLHAAEQLLGWTPRVPLEEGLKRTIEWYERELSLSTTDYAVTVPGNSCAERALLKT